jgi:hypothetical protein
LSFSGRLNRNSSIPDDGFSLSMTDTVASPVRRHNRRYSNEL